MIFTLVMEGRIYKGRGGREEKKLKQSVVNNGLTPLSFFSENHDAERIKSQRVCIYQTPMT